MRKRPQNKNFNLLYLIIFILTVGILGKTFSKLNLFSKDIAFAVNVHDGLKLMGEKDPVRKEMNIAIRKEEIRKEEVERKRKEEIERKEKEEIERKEKEEIARTQEEERLANINKKIAYLTFDDGPSVRATPMILDILKKHDVKATFFVVGKMININPDILKRTYDEGHKIGNHSYGHDYKYLYKNAKNFMDDIYKTENLIKSIVGEGFDSKVVRFPGGSFEEWKNPMKKAVVDAGYAYFDWNALNGDAEGIQFSEGHLLNRLKSTVGSKKKIIILMHDTDAKMTTATSLEASIKYLKSQGYEFEVLDKNFSWE